MPGGTLLALDVAAMGVALRCAERGGAGIPARQEGIRQGCRRYKGYRLYLVRTPGTTANFCHLRIFSPLSAKTTASDQNVLDMFSAALRRFDLALGESFCPKHKVPNK